MGSILAGCKKETEDFTRQQKSTPSGGSKRPKLS
jgi:hypothetical protein